jgi:hypothetical protein
MLPELAKIIQEQDDFVASDVFKDQVALLVASDDSVVKSFSVSQVKELLSLKDARFGRPSAALIGCLGATIAL